MEETPEELTDDGKNEPEEEKPGPQPADDTADAGGDGGGSGGAPTPDIEVDVEDVEEETEAERGIASITAKLSALAKRAETEKLKTVIALAKLDVGIGGLRKREEELRVCLENEVAAYNRASGKSDGKAQAFNELANELERDDANSAVAELERLIGFENIAILDAAKKLVGDLEANVECLTAFLNETTNPELIIDEGKAGGLSFERKQRAKKIAGLEQDHQKLVNTKGLFVANKDPEIIEAKQRLENAKFDQAAREKEMIALCQSIFNARAKIADLTRSIGKTNAFAEGIRLKAEGVEDTSDPSAIDTARQALEANAQLIGEAAGTRAKLVEKEQSATKLEDACTKLIVEQGRVLAALDAAKPLVADAALYGDLCNMIEGIRSRWLEKYPQGVQASIASSKMVDIISPVKVRLDAATLPASASLFDMSVALIRAGERLQELVDALSGSIKTANGKDPVQLQDVEDILVATARVQRFIDEEWPELKGGTREKIAEIERGIGLSIRDVLGPLEPLADFLEAGPTAWAEFQAWRADSKAEARGDTAAPDADAGATRVEEAEEKAPSDDGTDPVTTPRDPLPTVEAVEVDVDVDGAANGTADASGPEATVASDATPAPAVEVEESAFAPEKEEQPTPTPPRRKTNK